MTDALNGTSERRVLLQESLGSVGICVEDPAPSGFFPAPWAKFPCTGRQNSLLRCAGNCPVSHRHGSASEAGRPDHQPQSPDRYAAAPCPHPHRRSQTPWRPAPSFTSRGFLPWRLSDDGPSARRIVARGRHPKPFTTAEVKPLHRDGLYSRPSDFRRAGRSLGSRLNQQGASRFKTWSSAALNLVDGDWTSKPLQGTRSECPKLEGIAQSVADGTRDEDGIRLSGLT